MENIEFENGEIINQEHRILAKNTFFSFFNNYSIIIFQIIISLLIARIISIDFWGILILSTSCITIITVISFYFPPALDYSLNYYISQYIALNKLNKARSFIFKAIAMKIAFLIPIYIISIFVFLSFSDFFTLYLKGNLSLLFLLSPLIIILGLNPILIAINHSLNMFKTIFILSLIASAFKIIALLLCFLFISYVTLDLIVLINIITALIPFSINCIIILHKLHKYKNKNEKGISFKSLNKKVFSYGFPLSFGYLIYGFWDQFQIIGIGVFNTSESVTGYNISLGYSNYSTMVLYSFSNSLRISFSRLSSYDDYDKIISIFNLSYKYALFLLLLISGFLFFFTDFFLFIIFGESYMNFSIILKFMLISTIFKVIITPFDALLLAQKKVNLMPPIRIIMLLIYFPFFFIGLIYFGLLGGLIGILISNFLICCLYIFLTYKILKIRLNLNEIICQYFIFFIDLVITILLERLILYDLNLILFHGLKLSYLDKIPILSILIFIIIFIFFNLIFKIFTKKEIEYLELLFIKNSDTKFKNLLKKILDFLKNRHVFNN